MATIWKDFGIILDRFFEGISNKLDRRLKLSDLQDQLQRLEKERDDPTPAPKVMRPKTVRNIITGNVFSYDDLFKGNPDLEVIEWEEENADN